MLLISVYTLVATIFAMQFGCNSDTPSGCVSVPFWVCCAHGVHVVCRGHYIWCAGYGVLGALFFNMQCKEALAKVTLLSHPRKNAPLSIYD